MTTPKKTLSAATPAVPVANNPVNNMQDDLQNVAAPAVTAAAPDVPAPQATAPAPEATTIVSPQAPAPTASALPHGVTVDSIRAEAAEIAQIGAEAAKLGLMIDVSAALIAGTKPDALRRAVLEQLAASTDATIIASIAPRKIDEQPKESGLVAAAKEAAAQSA